MKRFESSPVYELTEEEHELFQKAGMKLILSRQEITPDRQNELFRLMKEVQKSLRDVHRRGTTLTSSTLRS